MRTKLLSTMCVLLAGAANQAAPVPITNSGFEANFAGPNAFSILIPQGWSLFDPNSIVDQSLDAVGVLNPTGGTNFPAGAPEGDNVALIYLETDSGNGPAGLTQVLTTSLAAEMRYTLTVEVGDIASGFNAPPFDMTFFLLDGFPGYQVQLLAGGVVIAQDDNTLAAVLDDGQFATSSISVDIPAGHPQIGQALEVRLINLNMLGTPEEPGIEVDFDDVRLDASPLPPPHCQGNANGDDIVNFDDISTVIANWLSAGPNGDANHDGAVNFNDVNVVLVNWLSACP